MRGSVLFLPAGGKAVERLVLVPGAAPDGSEEDRARRPQEEPDPQDDEHDHDHESRLTAAPGRCMAVGCRSADIQVTGAAGCHQREAARTMRTCPSVGAR
jgi:hypothetical protein